MMEKKCSQCRDLRDVSEFHQNNGTKDGRQGICKSCTRKKRLEYQSINPDASAEQCRRYYQENRESRIASAWARYRKNAKDPEFRKRVNARKRGYAKEYGKRPRSRKLQAAASKRYASKTNIRISRRMGFQVWFSLRDSLNGGNGKGGKHWEELVPYTLEELMSHLKGQFRDGMNWGNYGGKKGWQIDHIVPKSWFSMHTADDEQFKKCWDLSNLQPLWLKDNAAKGNRFAG